MQGSHFIPRVAIQQVYATHQAILLFAKAEDIQLTEIKMHDLIAKRRRRVIFEVDDNRQMANFARTVQRFRRWCRQTQREVVRDIGDHLLQLRQVDNTVTLNKQMRTRCHQTVKPRPRHQLIEIAVIFQRLMADDRIHVRRAVVEIPTRTVGATWRHVDKSQVGF